jgi:seryl-tRNA synthetase
MSCRIARRALSTTASASAPAPQSRQKWIPYPDYNGIATRHADFARNCAERGVSSEPVTRVTALWQRHLDAVRAVESVRAQRNALAKRASDAAVRAEVMAESKQLRVVLSDLEAKANAIHEEMLAQALLVPNEAHPDAPRGDEHASRTARHHGNPVGGGDSSSSLRSHIDIGQAQGWFDFEAGAAVSGSKFVYLRRDAALLELALVQWTLGELAKRNFEPILPPDVVLTQAVAACGFQPRGDASQVYALDPRVATTDMCLVGTSEIPLTAEHAGRIFEPSQLPIRSAGFGHCFRAEAGALGAHSRGMYRLHQFSKVEMVMLVDPQHSDRMLDELVAIQESIVQQLELPYRIRDMATGDLGASAYRKFDLEAWMPSRNDWGELCSASNCTDYQSRRLNVRFRRGAESPLPFVHTLNATALAVPRVILAIVENHQQRDGTVRLPPPLRRFMGDRESIGKPVFFTPTS